MNKKTDDLFNILKSEENIGDYFAENIEEIYPDSIPELLAYFLKEKGLTKSQALDNSLIEKHYGYQIFSGKKKPSRDKVIMLCFGMGLNLKETQSFLKKCTFSELYPRNRRDAVIIFCLQHKCSIMEADELLYDYNLTTFIREEK